MAPNRHRSHGVAAPTCSTTCSSGCSATVGTAPAGPSPTAAKARSSSAPPPWATERSTATRATGTAPAMTAPTPSISPSPGRSHCRLQPVHRNGSLQKGVGHLRGSALPVGGKNTHAVLSAHRGLPTSRLFTDLDKVRNDHYDTGEFAAARRRHRIRAGAYNTLNGNLALRQSRATTCPLPRRRRRRQPRASQRRFRIASLTEDGATRRSANAPANAATQRPAPRITPPIGRIASPSQSANKRRLASLTDSVIALPYFVPRKPFEADVGAVRAWESPYATAKLNNR